MTTTPDRGAHDTAALIAAQRAIKDAGPLYTQTPADIIEKATLAGVGFDRKRMAEKLRHRVMANTEPMTAPPEDQELLRKFDAMMLDLADQIERGLPDEP